MFNNLEKYTLPYDESFDKVPKNHFRIVRKKVGEPPTIEFVKDTLEAKQKLVNGLIEIVNVNDDILIVCNEEGKLLNQEPNLVFDYDYIAGDCFFIGNDYENGDFKSITKEQIQEIEDIINDCSVRYIKPFEEKEL